ncbi:MAG: asparagine synthase (glutamine-hydrolyzing) [Planctomycetes bacterium]|nr:asparagine synthase (glutamine-hydrolyzing) [Planctomycetota bacterium]
MCGIAGAIGVLDDRVMAVLDRVDRAQSHRGPDGHGLWRSTDSQTGPGAAFAHRRLAIIDLDERAAQPMTDAPSGNVIAFNGEIYNFRELRDELERAGVTFKTTSDTEVILAAWNAWGESMLARLAGMFAFALFEKKTGDVILARDRIGIKPLYFGLETHASGSAPTLLFASEVRALLAGGSFERRLDPVALSGFVWHGFVRGDGTLVHGIRSLPAGTFARVASATLRVEPQVYWRLPAPTTRRRDTEELAHVTQRAVREHMISDVPLAVFLSGGVDSSAIANLTTREARGVSTYNVGFDETEFDESKHARAVATALGTDHHEIRLSGARFSSDLPRALAALDQPTFDGINTWFVSKAVREAGVVVALAGTGGDELFGGYSSFRDLPRVRRASRALGLVPRGWITRASRAAVRARNGAVREMPPQTRWGKLGDALVARGSLVELYQTAYALFSQDFYGELLSRDIVSLTSAGLTAAQADDLAHKVRGRTELDAVSLLEIESFLTSRLLRDTDAVSMDVSLEVRVPLLDHRILEAVFALDDSVRFADLGTKAPLRSIGLNGLDPALFERKKSGFVLPIERWCRAELGSEIDGVFADADTCRSVGLAPAAVAKLWRAFKNGEPGIYWSRVWAIYALLRWCKTHEVRL